MNSAREKLLEAQYFLQRMHETSSRREAFKYNLSAFLSAAKSVRWFLKEEYEHKPDFKQWWNSKKEWKGLQKEKGAKWSAISAKLRTITDPVRATNVFFDEVRHMTIHYDSVRPRAHVGVKIAEQTVSIASIEGVVIRADGPRERDDPRERIEKKNPEPPPTPDPSGAAETKVEWRWYFNDLPPAVEQQDVVTLSEEHIRRLEAFLSECESRFAS